jgi:hypothetical protein
MGLGPFQYYFPEMGATNPCYTPDESCRKPGLDDPSAVGEFVSGLRMACADDYARYPEKMDGIRSNFAKKLAIKSFPDSCLQVPVTVSVKRNLANRPFNSVIDFRQRREVESELVSALKSISTDGVYHAFPGSQSHAPQMSLTVCDLLRSRGLMFEPPWTTYDLSCGTGRHWPDARGIFQLPSSGSVDCVAWINGEDHLEIVAVSRHGDVKEAVRIAQSFINQLEKKLSFALSEACGNLTMKPEDSGTGQKISAVMELPYLFGHPDFAKLCARLRLRPFVLDKQHMLVNLMSVERFGLTPEENGDRTRNALNQIVEIDKGIPTNRNLVRTVVLAS